MMPRCGHYLTTMSLPSRYAKSGINKLIRAVLDWIISLRPVALRDSRNTGDLGYYRLQQNELATYGAEEGCCHGSFEGRQLKLSSGHSQASAISPSNQLPAISNPVDCPADFDPTV